MSGQSKHVAVIGAGPGGYAAAFRAADLGLQVSLIDPEKNPGGVCVYRGCIPSKALLHVAKLLEEARHSAAWGITFGKPRIEIDKLRAWKDDVVSKLTGGAATLARVRKIDYIQGRARFRDRKGLVIDRADGTAATLDFDYAIIATGSRPSTVPGLSVDSPRVMDSTAALALQDVPGTLLVIGGGYIGLELATVYAALGSRVTVVEMQPALLSGADPDLVKVLAKQMTPRMEDVLVGTKVAKLTAQANGVEVRLEGPEVRKPVRRFDKVLISVGRRPNSEDLGLENTRVQVDDRGFIVTDDERRTREPTILAIGDVAGNPMLAHKATHEAHVAAGIAAGQKVRFNPRAIPAVVFTDPEIAWCGLTELDAKREGIAYESASFPWTASGRATAMGRNDGLTKILFDPESRVVLGVGIVGSGAGELIGEGALAVEMGATAEDIALTIHPHPTMTESVMESAELFLGLSDHYYRPKRK